MQLAVGRPHHQLATARGARTSTAISPGLSFPSSSLSTYQLRAFFSSSSPLAGFLLFNPLHSARARAYDPFLQLFSPHSTFPALSSHTTTHDNAFVSLSSRRPL